MMKAITTYLSLVTIVILCTGCPKSSNEPDSNLTIVNNSAEEIVHFDQFNSSSDTSLSTFPFPIVPENASIRTIEPGKSDVIPDSFNRLFKEHPDKVLMLYLFSRDTVEQVPWDSIVSDYKVLRRYDLSLSDLESRGWKVEYP